MPRTKTFRVPEEDVDRNTQTGTVKPVWKRLCDAAQVSGCKVTKNKVDNASKTREITVHCGNNESATCFELRAVGLGKYEKNLAQ